jgi:TRAP-type C4-dicarboxylate transport system permease small subunit
MIIMVFAFLGLAQSEKSHINVDVVFNHLPPKMQAGLEWFNHLICFLIFALVSWRGIHRTIDMITSGEESILLKIPDYPFAIFMVLGSIVLTIEFLRDVISLSGSKKEDKA